MRFLGSKYANNAFAAGAPPRTPLGGVPGRRGGGREGEGWVEGENCCHQMSDFMAKMRERAI